MDTLDAIIMRPSSQDLVVLVRGGYAGIASLAGLEKKKLQDLFLKGKKRGGGLKCAGSVKRTRKREVCKCTG